MWRRSGVAVARVQTGGRTPNPPLDMETPPWPVGMAKKKKKKKKTTVLPIHEGIGRSHKEEITPPAATSMDPEMLILRDVRG